MPNAIVMTRYGPPEVLTWAGYLRESIPLPPGAVLGFESWADAAALPSSAEAAAGVLRQLNVTRGETLLLFGGGGSVGVIATQLAVARGITVHERIILTLE
jgi:NADPH:quinone reductase-like Zn-dependent oxidoreductase